MKKIYLLISIITLGITIFITNSCNKENIDNQKDTLQLTARNSSLGQYSVVDGRLYFPTFNDYNQTKDYLASANESEITAFRTSILIETPAKTFDAFMSAISLLDSNSTQLPSLESQFSNKIKISTDENGDRKYEPKVDINKEIVNLKGEVQINTGIYIFYNTKVISVLNPALIDLNTISENTVTDEQNGVYAIDIITLRNCCPQSNTSNTMYGPESKRKRITNNYQAFAEALVVGTGNDQKGNYYTLAPSVTVKASTLHELHRHILLFWWWEKFKVKELKQDFSIKMYHEFEIAGIPDPINIVDTKTEPNTALIEKSWIFKGNLVKFYGTQSGIQDLVNNCCVSKVHIKGINTSIDSQPFNEFDCMD